MRIIIAGAGDTGFHLAQLLSYENHDITLIDNSEERLEYVSDYLDLLTLQGDAGTPSTLREARAAGADLFLAVTSTEHTNLIAALLAKQAGVKTAIARVNEEEYLETNHSINLIELGIDALFSPRKLAAEEIYRLLKQSAFTDLHQFEEGKINLVGITLNEASPLLDARLDRLGQIETDLKIRPIAILRGQHTLIPNGTTVLRRNDHIYFISKKENTAKLEKFIGTPPIEVKRVMIIGGSELGYATAKVLEKDYRVTLVESNRNRCKDLAGSLNNTLVVQGKPGDVNLLVEEGLDSMDAFIALTENSEINIIVGLTAKQHNVPRTIALVDNREYTFLSQDIGVDALINKKILAANNIFRYVRQGRVEAITTLHGVDAEVIEFTVHKNNRLTRRPLKDLHFPDAARIGGVIRGEEAYIPEGDFQLQVEDKVIVFALPEAVSWIEKMFR